MCLRKSDPTGNYWYMADGVAPASPVLTDAYTTFTPGISEINSGGSRFYLPDGQGNSRALLDGSQNGTDGYNWDAWGNSVSRVGSNPTAWAWNVSSGYQSDGDSGLKLLGHRYYDSRTGRFISQDPAGDGDNWYAYADNDPTDGTDPSGLDPKVIDTGTTWIIGHSFPDLGGWGEDYNNWQTGFSGGLFYAAMFQNKTNRSGQARLGRPNPANPRNWQRSFHLDDPDPRWGRGYHINAEIGPFSRIGRFGSSGHVNLKIVDKFPKFALLGSTKAMKAFGVVGVVAGVGFDAYEIATAAPGQRGAAIGDVAGSTIGAVAFGALGSAILPGVGTAIGAGVGGYLGGLAGSAIGGWFDH